jgi:hypothetical protein
MTEYELMYLMSETANRNWEMWQYWTGVSFGYLILGYVAAKHLNWLLIFFVSALYTLFSIFLFQVLGHNAEILFGTADELRKLQSSGVELTAPAARWLAGHSEDSMLPVAVLLVTYLAALLYLPYNHIKSDRGDT